MGLIALFNQHEDYTGYQLRLAGSHHRHRLQVTRPLLDHTESGQGRTSLTTQAALAEIAYTLSWPYQGSIQPYVALRHSRYQTQ